MEAMHTTANQEIFAMDVNIQSEQPPKDILAMKASTDPDTMYYHEAMCKPDAEQFRTAMRKEVDDQLNNGVLQLVRRDSIPQGAAILPAVWQMKRKRHIKTWEIYKWKARLNIDGSRSVYKRDYEQTYSPVVGWGVIRLLLVLILVHKWHSVQLDYVLAFTQAPADRELYMEIPKGLTIEGANKGEYVFKLLKNTYGKKDAGRVWNHYLVKQLEKVGFTQSKIDECVFYKGSMIYILYTDDSILAGPNREEIDSTIKQMQEVVRIEPQGDITDFLGVNIERKSKGEYVLTQPQLIDQIISGLRLDKSASSTKDIPMKSSAILDKGTGQPAFDGYFHYRSIIGKLGYLEKGSRPELAYAVHQCARFSSEPKKQHADALKWIGRYLISTDCKGMSLKPDLSKSFEVFGDADFCGNWKKEYRADPASVRSQHGYIIMYAGCPLVWKSQLQTEIALSSTESEYTGLSYVLREAIPIMELLKEMREHGFEVLDPHPQVHCKVFEDNSGALEIASVHKWRPRTKHLATKLHHFRSYVTKGDITIHPISTEDQPADILTKPLNHEVLTLHRKTIMGW